MRGRLLTFLAVLALIGSAGGAWGSPGATIADKNCSDFSTQQEALHARLRRRSAQRSTRTKNRVYLNYGIRRDKSGAYEVDHLISLELGGSNSIRNLWPEKQPGARSKDKIENRLHEDVCDGTISLRTAQKQIVRWWLHT